jgi:chromosome segregation ATPase
MTEQNQEHIQAAGQYIEDLIKRLDEGAKGLDKREVRLATKLRDARARADALAVDTQKLNDQIVQANARLRSQEVQLSDAVGKANGLYEAFVDYKLLDYEEGEALPKAPAPSSNGKQKKKKKPAGRPAPRAIG